MQDKGVWCQCKKNKCVTNKKEGVEVGMFESLVT
jgi:hypothetical protein